VTKQGVAPSSAPGGSLTQKSGVIPGSTPARPPGLGDASKLIPTLLDYANEQNVSPSKSTTDKSATGTGSPPGALEGATPCFVTVRGALEGVIPCLVDIAGVFAVALDDLLIIGTFLIFVLK
jgi:hypothetical protein